MIETVRWTLTAKGKAAMSGQQTGYVSEQWTQQVSHTLVDLERRLAAQQARNAELAAELVDLIARLDAVVLRVDRLAILEATVTDQGEGLDQCAFPRIEAAEGRLGKLEQLVTSLDEAVVSHIDAKGHTPR